MTHNLNCNDKTLSIKRKEFKERLIESIEDVLDFSKVVLNFLELNSDFRKDRILDNPQIFSRELTDIFGSSSKGIEKLIIKRLYKKTHIKYVEQKGKSFSDYIFEGMKVYNL
jgi:predicted HTH transcriptional regulator